jgi:hypothetical protein
MLLRFFRVSSSVKNSRRVFAEVETGGQETWFEVSRPPQLLAQADSRFA